MKKGDKNKNNFSREQRNKYVWDNGNRCPHCNMWNKLIAIGPVQVSNTLKIDKTSVRLKIRCLNCNREWNDKFSLYDIE